MPRWLRLCNAYQVSTHALVLAVSVFSWAAKAFRLARSAVHVYGGKQDSKCLRNVSGAVWRARCLDHACRLAAIASGATTLCTTPAPTVRHLNVWRWWTNTRGNAWRLTLPAAS